MLARCSLITVNDYLNYKVDFNLKKLFSNYEFNESIFKILKNIKIRCILINNTIYYSFKKEFISGKAPASYFFKFMGNFLLSSN